MRTLLVALALTVSTGALAQAPAAAPSSPATAERGERWAWELDAYAGYGQIAWPMPDQTNMTWSNGGPAFALSVAFRGEHFTHPFFDVSYVPVYASGQYVNTFTGGAKTTTFASNSSYAIGLIVGPGFDIDWFRLRLGLGIYDTFVKTSVAGESSTISQLGVGFLVGASALLWQPDPFALGIEGRLVALQLPMTGIFQTMWSVGLTGRWDFARSKN